MARVGDDLDFRSPLLNVTGDVLNGASVKVNIRKPDLSLVVTGGTAPEIGSDGVYRYYYSSSDAVGRWQAQFTTTDANADILSVTTWIDVEAAEDPINDDAILAAVGTPMQTGESVTVATNNDKTGYALTSDEHTLMSGTDVPTALTEQGLTTTRASYLDILSGLVDAIWSAATRTLTAFGFTMALDSSYDAAKTAASQSSVDAVAASVALLAGGAGIYAVTVQLYLTGTQTPLADVSAAVYNAGGELVGLCQRSNAGGQCVFALDAGTYTVRLLKSGYVFDVETLTVSADMSQTVYGEAVTIPLPENGESCTLYEYCFDTDEQTPLSKVTASAAIISKPFDANGRLHDVTVKAGTYDVAKGLQYWSMPRGAVVNVKIKEMGLDGRGTIPDAENVRASSIIK